MTFSLAGRPTLVVFLLAAITFFFFLALSPSHPSFRPSIHNRDVVHALHPREVTITAEVTTTVLATTSTTISASDVAVSKSSGSHDPSASLTPTLSAFSTSFTPSTLSAFSTSSAGSLSPSPSSSSSHREHHKETRTSTSAWTSSVTTKSTLVLVPTPLNPSPATTLVATGDPLTSASPTSVTQVTPTASSSASPVEATSAGFWSSKGAVGGTFTVVGLIIAGIIVFLLFTYVKRVKENRSRRHDEELFSNFFDQSHSRHGSASASESLDHPALDPFAAGEVIQVPGSATSLHSVGAGMANNPPISGSKIGHGGYGSDDGHPSSIGHSSSNHHGFSSISYHTQLSEPRGNIAQAESPLFYESPKSAPSPISSQPRPEDPFSNTAAVPLSANTASTTYTIPSPYLGAGQANNRLADSDASYYADQIHSYYYGAGATAPLPPRSFHQAF